MAPTFVPEVDPSALEERRVRWRARLSELRPQWSPGEWLAAARGQLAFWLHRAGLAQALPSRLRGVRRAPHGFDLSETFAAFFCFADPKSDGYFELPFMVAVLRGDADEIRATAEALQIDPEALSPALFGGPFPPARGPR